MQHEILKPLILLGFLTVFYGFESRYLHDFKKCQNTRNAVKLHVSRHFLIIARNNELLIFMT